jgi:hypothetical protein
VPVTYSDKVALFSEHAHLAKDECYRCGSAAT